MESFTTDNLGPKDGVIRLFRPDAVEVELEVKGERVKATPIGNGLFEYKADVTPYDYHIFHQNGLRAHDPYAFEPTLTHEAFSHAKLYETMGGRLIEHSGVTGVRFAVWAPRAKRVFLVADHNNWVGSPMRQIDSSGVWELFVPGLSLGEKYKYEIDGARLKADPFAFQGEMRPKTASIVACVDSFEWTDHSWMENRLAPQSIYEVHLGSWKQQDGEFINYREAAPRIVEYCKAMGFTHVELMPIMGHPLDESWGYQVSGYYAISRRYGLIEDFQYFVNMCHMNNLGVILDWVPGHFPTDDHALATFDGAHLFEYEDPKMGYHPKWNTHIFNFGKEEVQRFLIGSALFYLEKMHVDGLRVDAVDSMLHLDFFREEGEWIPNKDGGSINYDAITFLTKLNKTVHETFPNAVMISEDSSNFCGITSKLGFDMNWNLGWMHDTLKCFTSDFSNRRETFHLLVHTFTYIFDEKSLLPLSHDEVSHNRKSLLQKMPGTKEEKCQGVKLLLTYMACYPGKTLLFMGGEFGQIEEWNCKEEIPWELLDHPLHADIRECVLQVNHFVKEHPALHSDDFSPETVEIHRAEYPILAYKRKGGNQTLLCVHNVSNEAQPLTFSGTILFASNHTSDTIPPLTTVILSE